ncbi:MAG: 50S ribosomal protein L22 [Candidatus Omnitrophota bacterium]|nr:MAG: 50S ribosomal protein L22 [Candidatus Omnitrophota bacterium]
MTKIIPASKAYARHIRISPRKTREVIDLIRGEKVGRALAILQATNRRAVVYVRKLLNSAISNAKINPQIILDELFISKITADNGPMLKRYRAAAMGRASMIRRRTTHLAIELATPEIQPVKTKVKKKMPLRRSRERVQKHSQKSAKKQSLKPLKRKETLKPLKSKH